MALLYTQLLTSSLVSPEIKGYLKESTVIDATNVSDYYYQGTDQEYWDIGEDFPNIAPPFEQFFMEFRAPMQITSKEHGTYAWETQERPKRWGILCLSREMNAALQDWKTDEGREQIQANFEQQLQALGRGLGPYRTAVDTIISGTGENARDALNTWSSQIATPGFQDTVQQYFFAKMLTSAIQMGLWDDLEKFGSQGQAMMGRIAARWSLQCVLFMQYPCSRHQHQLAPCVQWHLMVDADGLPIKAGDKAFCNTTAMGPMAKGLEHVANQDGGLDTLSTIHDQIMQFLHTGLLTISFMHCKNVVLKKTESTPTKPLSNRQKW